MIELKAGAAVYSHYSVKRLFGVSCSNSVIVVDLDERHKRISCLLSTMVYVPKLDVAGSTPVSRSIKSTTWKQPIHQRYCDYCFSGPLQTSSNFLG